MLAKAGIHALIDELAQRAGFALADMRAFDKVISPAAIAATRAAAVRAGAAAH